jgi:hypothetical protein
MNWEGPRDEEALIDRLGELAAWIDPVPARVEAAALAAFRGSYSARGQDTPQIVQKSDDNLGLSR